LPLGTHAKIGYEFGILIRHCTQWYWWSLTISWA